MAATNNNNTPQPVITFVFVDLEATGLNGIGEKPRITELSLIATHRESILEKSYRNTPRVLNKLILCLDPHKAIGCQASLLTGLYNDELSLQRPFSEEVVDLCTLFLEQLPPPICLLAHNGHKYDFPLLAAELFRLGRHFPADILCADTLDGFRDVLLMEEVQASIRTTARPANEFPDRAVVNGVTSKSHPARPQRPVVRRLVMNDADMVPLSNVTPEMQVVKANDKITNAPMKKAICRETAKEIRVSSAKRKLEFGGPPASDLTKNAVDDVDREDVMDEIHGFHLALTGAHLEKRANETVSGGCEGGAGSEGFRLGDISQTLWEDDVQDDVLVEALDEFEQNLVKMKSFAADVIAPTVSIRSKTAVVGVVPVAKSWASVVQGTNAKSDYKENISSSSSTPSCSRDEDISSSIGSHSPVSSTKSAFVTKHRTPPNIIDVPLIASYPTPPPSEHKDIKTFSSKLSPLATPFVPQSLRLVNKMGYSHGGQAGNSLGISMALGSLHKRLLGYEPPDMHRAEDDCMALLRLGNRLSPWFCDWVDKHAILFSTTSPMYKATKRPKKP